MILDWMLSSERKGRKKETNANESSPLHRMAAEPCTINLWYGRFIGYMRCSALLAVIPWYSPAGANSLALNPA
ncbi:hypothetical protein AFCA_008953 [Aspergillus flavus]|nr:hypothetical protein AFCA_008953 [Aspergillus flavus]